ncbi:hypothetical protein ACFVXE_08520 [Streptomyces sp. NPDC058231]|uniref:hypothetical protein n=1 Tax=Streptomyces sp. NPDC058231 TaxID=3346392 RepID=UPI0036E189B8
MPDGTPIAVVAERDCVGNVQQTGWLNLSTGAFTTGVPPAAAGACGDARSITVSGVFCDAAPDGTVFGLVLVEYHYADDGSIDSVRLVDAATGATYTLQGQLSICPSGGDEDESPGEPPCARQIVERCACDDTTGDGIGDVRYVELWSVDTCGASPAFLVGTYVDGDFDQPYTPQNPVDCTQDAGGDESPGEPTQTCAPQIVERCGCDDVDGDGLGDVRFTELWAVDPCTPGATPTLLGTWIDGDFDQPYTPVAPVDCPAAAGGDGDESPGQMPPTFEVAPVPLCLVDDATDDVLQNVLAEIIYDQTTGNRTGVRYVDSVTGNPVALPGGTHLAVCPNAADPCVSSVTVMRMCDLNPAVAPDADGKRCAVPFLRHMVYDCTGAVTEVRDTELDGTTAYTPVNVVDCTGGVPSLVELDWPLSGIVEDPALPGGRDFIYTVTNPDTGDVATVHLHASNPAGGSCGPYDPTHPVFNNPTAYRLDLSPEAQAMTRFRLDFNDLDNFEGISGLTPRPDSVVFENGTGTYDPATGTIRTNESANPGPTVLAYWNTPPATITWGYANNGGGTACCFVSFLGTTLKAGGCCSQCTGTGDGESPGQPEPCRDTSSSLLCDVSATSTVTVLDTAGVTDGDGWTLASYDTGGCAGYNAPEVAISAAPIWSAPAFLSVRADGNLGLSTSCDNAWGGYDAAPVRWVLTKTFTAPEDGMALISATALLADGACKIRVNGTDTGHYAQWNLPANGASSQVPVTAGPNVIEVEVRDVGGANWLQGRLDVVMTSTQQFMRKQVTDCETGAVISTTDTTLDGQPYTVTGTVGQCEQVQECCPTPPPEQRVDVETHVLCVVAADGTVTQVLAEYVYDDQSGDRTNTRYVDLATGDPVTVPADATVSVCGADDAEDESPGEAPCRNSSTLLVCDLPQDGEPTPTLADTDPTPYYPDTVAAPVSGAQTLWDGGTLTLPPGTGPQPGTPGKVNSLAATITGVRPACDDGTATVTVSVLVAQTGPDKGCAQTGHMRLFNGAQQVALEVVPANTPVGWSGTLTVTASVPAADLAAGNVAVVMALDSYDVCSGAPRETGWNLSQFTASTVYDQTGCAQQVLANVVTDCDTGQVESVTYTTLDGAPYSVTGEVGQCTATSLCTPAVPCGDTEVAQLCNLTYDPQAPIPTPAGDFTLTGNVVPVNGGTTLWFAQANQVANGTAELTVSGLLPAVMYEFRFASAWIGAGAPDPANNNAIYLLEVLDGTTVLATRTRNTSNGSSAFPGGALSEDLPPLAFIAPATGAVTIRFTDQTTGGAINDRDLYLMPIEVRTAVLTVTSTPFLRRFTFDCDGGLTATQDLGLDGATPYVVEGEVGSCASSGDGSSVTAPTGDVVDCENGSRALLVKVCDASDELPGEPCGDTELVQLCDLVYSPEPPFPTPMSAFARTGNVKVVGAGLYYSGGNVAPNGVATLPVTGLTGDTGYAFRFSTSWAGSGVPNPAASDAIYLVEILDGTTVLASLQRNISNGTGAATGYVNETPLSFTAPASGAVTLRISDVSTGNGADRDLIVIPADVRSEALTVGSTAFLRAITFGCDGSVTSTHDLALDGVTPYTVAGEVATCAAGGDGATTTAPGPDTEAVVLCDLLADPDADPVPFLRLLTVTADGTITAADTALDGATPYTVAGTVGVCPGAPDGPVKVVEQCRCDQTADGVVEYVELIAVAEDGTLTTIGTYDEAFTPYTPVSPVACPVEGAPPAMGVQARRVELAPGGSWSAAGVTLLQSVTAVSHAGNGTVTTMDGDSTLHDGENVTWSVARDTDAALTGPLTITAGTGTVTVAFTTAVTL